MKTPAIIALSTIGTVLVLAGGIAWWQRPRWEPLAEMRQAANEAGQLLREAMELGVPLTTREFYPDNGDREFTSLWIAYKEAKLNFKREDRERMKIVYPRSTYDERVEHLRNVVALESDIVSSIQEIVKNETWGLNIAASPQLEPELDNMIRFLLTAAFLDAIDGNVESVIQKLNACIVIMKRGVEFGVGSERLATHMSSYYSGLLDLILLDPKHRTEYLSVRVPRDWDDLLTWNTVFGGVARSLDQLRYDGNPALVDADPAYLDSPLDRDGLPVDEVKRARCAILLQYAIKASRYFGQGGELTDEAGLLVLTDQMIEVQFPEESSDYLEKEGIYAPQITLLQERNRFVDTLETLTVEMSEWMITEPIPKTWNAKKSNPMWPERPLSTEYHDSILIMRAEIPVGHELHYWFGGDLSIGRPLKSRLPQPLWVSL